MVKRQQSLLATIWRKARRLSAGKNDSETIGLGLVQDPTDDFPMDSVSEVEDDEAENPGDGSCEETKVKEADLWD